MLFQLPGKPTVDHTSNSLDDSNILRKRLLGAAVLIALAVIFLPLLLDGSGTESRFRRVEQLRVEPPRILNEAGQPEVPDAPAAAKPALVTPEPAKPLSPESLPPKPEPTEPEVKQVVIPKTAPQTAPKAEPVAETSPARTIALPTQPTVAESPTVKPEPVEENQSTPSNNAGTASAWVIQAGSFSDEGNALSMRDQVRAAGYPAFVSSKGESADGKTLFRVKVGPITERDKASAVQSDLQSLLGQKTLIKPYP